MGSQANEILNRLSDSNSSLRNNKTNDNIDVHPGTSQSFQPFSDYTSGTPKTFFVSPAHTDESLSSDENSIESINFVGNLNSLNTERNISPSNAGLVNFEPTKQPCINLEVAGWAVENKISCLALGKLLNILKPYHPTLPLDSRTLLKTPY